MITRVQNTPQSRPQANPVFKMKIEANTAETFLMGMQDGSFGEEAAEMIENALKMKNTDHLILTAIQHGKSTVKLVENALKMKPTDNLSLDGIQPENNLVSLSILDTEKKIGIPIIMYMSNNPVVDLMSIALKKSELATNIKNIVRALNPNTAEESTKSFDEPVKSNMWVIARLKKLIKEKTVPLTDEIKEIAEKADLFLQLKLMQQGKNAPPSFD